MIARDLFPWSVQKVLSGETVTISKIADLPPDADRDRENYHLYGTRSTVLVPLIRWERAGIRPAELCRHASGERLAGHDRREVRAYLAGVPERPCPKAGR